MGITNKYVYVGLNGKTIKYYENLGYEIPRKIDKYDRITVPKKSKIKVKVKDLQKGSHVLVDVKCDYCEEILRIPYKSFIASNHDGKYYCNHCKSKVLTSGCNNPNWKNDKTKFERECDRSYQEYGIFVQNVLKRDKYTCKCCGKIGDNKLEVHHLNGYNWDKEHRTDINNGVTLCYLCHKKFHDIYGKGNNTKEQFDEFIGKSFTYNYSYKDDNLGVNKIYCLEEDKIYNSAKDFSKHLEVSINSVYDVCNHRSHTVKGLHIFWYKEYINKNKNELLGNDEYKNKKKVICLTTGKIFNSIIEAGRYYKIKSTNCICYNCLGKQKTCGKLEDGTRLVWSYYNENNLKEVV